MTLATVIDKVKTILSGHDALIEKRERLVRELAAAAAGRQAEIDKAQAEVDALDEPRKRLERLKAEALVLGTAAQQKIAAVDRELEQTPTPEETGFTAVLDRLEAHARASSVPSPEETVHFLSGQRTTTNRDVIERHLEAVSGPLDPEGRHPFARLPSVRAQARDFCARELPRLPAAEQKRQLAEWRRALEASVAGTVFEKDLA